MYSLHYLCLSVIIFISLFSFYIDKYFFIIKRNVAINVKVEFTLFKSGEKVL